MTYLFPHLLSFLLLLLPISTFSQTSCNLRTLTTLDANPYCSSPSGEFAFGFHPIQGGDHFLLAIWFAKIQVENIVWTANGGNPVQKGSKIELTSNGVLVLNAPNGTELWKAEPTDGTQATSAAMLDTGNFVLRNAQSVNNWQSFDAPTDTILLNQTLGLGSKLVSRRTKDDYSMGRFEFILQGDGNLVMYPLARPKENNYTAYWESNTVSNGAAVVFNQSGHTMGGNSAGGRQRRQFQQGTSIIEPPVILMEFSGHTHTQKPPQTVGLRHGLWNDLYLQISAQHQSEISAADFADITATAC